ncbi:hypothetical protein [Streptomyces sp. NPDC019507]|uniref:hypothetical protein n=1 Tax=Streptomyces sp. NPDC019507 TaxID=3154689 RepID=UPI00341144F0
MSDALRTRLRRARETRERSRIEGSLPGTVFRGFTEAGGTPPWFDAETARFRRTATPPDHSTAEQCPEAVGAWVEDLVEQRGFTGTVLVHVGFDGHTWLRCDRSRPRWARAVRDALGRWDLALLSSDGELLLVVSEEEYACLAFVSTGTGRERRCERKPW